MNNRILVLVIAIACISQANGQFINFWNATVTDATVYQCSDGAIDLHPPLSNNIYSFVWFRTGSPFPMAYTEDISDLAPGQYTVEINGPLCDDIELTYFVGLREYNFDLIVANPGNCEPVPVKRIEGSGGVLLTWNDDVLPTPNVTLQYPAGNTVPLLNETWVSANEPGRYTLFFEVGDCQWNVIRELCCCSVSGGLEVFPGALGLCESLTDGIPFEIETSQVTGASGYNERDGSIGVQISSPALNSTIEWVGPTNRRVSRTFYGTYIQNLLPGEYCYEYKDDCQNLTGCVIVDNCNPFTHSEGTFFRNSIRAIIGACLGEPDGSIQLSYNTEGTTVFDVFEVNNDGSTGDIAGNVEVDFTYIPLTGEILISFLNLIPGDYTFRVITEQSCETDITFSIPVIVDQVGELNYETCSRELLCDGEYARTVYYDWEILPSEYCYVERRLCSIPGSSPVENSIFDETLVSEIEISSESCSFLYPCDDGPIRVNGNIGWNPVSFNCLPTPPQVSLVQVCKIEIAGESVSVPLYDPETKKESVTKWTANNPDRNCEECTINPSIPLSEKGHYRTYTWTDGFGYDYDFDCCKKCPIIPRPENATLVGIDEKIQLIDCFTKNNIEQFGFVNLSTGRSSNLTEQQIHYIISRIRKQGNILNTSDISNYLSSGIFVLTSPNCESIHVTII